MGLAALSSDSTASLMGPLQDAAHRENCVRSIIGGCAPGGGGEDSVRRGRLQPCKSAAGPLYRDRRGHWASCCLALAFQNAGLKYIFFSLKINSVVLRKICTQESMTCRCGILSLQPGRVLSGLLGHFPMAVCDMWHPPTPPTGN